MVLLCFIKFREFLYDCRAAQISGANISTEYMYIKKPSIKYYYYYVGGHSETG